MKKLKNEDIIELKEILDTINLSLKHSHSNHLLYIPFKNFPKELERNKILKWIEKLEENKIIINSGRVVGAQADNQEIEIRVEEDKNHFFNFHTAINKKFKKIKKKKKTSKIFTPKFFTPFGDIHYWEPLESIFKKRGAIIIIIIAVISFCTIFSLIKDKPGFNFTSLSGGGFEVVGEEFPKIAEIVFNGNIVNTFQTKRTLERIDYVVWKNRAIGSSYTYGYHAGNLYLYTSNGVEEEIKTPVLFEPNESKHFRILLKINIENEEREKEIFSLQTRGFLYWHDNNIELLFKDANGNFYDQGGKLIHKKTADKWWTLPNNKKFLNRTLAIADALKEVSIWRIRRFFHLVKN